MEEGYPLVVPARHVGPIRRSSWHLFHPQSVAHTRELPTSEQYRRNVALLNEAARLNTPARFSSRGFNPDPRIPAHSPSNMGCASSVLAAARMVTWRVRSPR